MPLIPSASAGCPGSCSNVAAMPPAPSCNDRSSARTSVALTKLASSVTAPRPSSRVTSISAAPSPLPSDSRPSRRRAISSPNRGAPSVSVSALISPILTETGSSGRRNGVASAISGESGSSAIGARATMISRAVRRLTSTRPRKSAVRVQSSATSRSVSQMPSRSAMVSSSIVARDDSAPAKPVIRTSRPAPDRLSSRRACR